MLVKDFMIKDVYVVHPHYTLKEILRILIENKVGGVPVVDDQNKLLGMITDGDILRYLKPAEDTVMGSFQYVAIMPGEELDETVTAKMNDKVSSLIHNRKVTTLMQEDTLETLIQIISKHHFKKIPVVDDSNQVIGIISRGDALRILYREFAERLDSRREACRVTGLF